MKYIKILIVALVFIGCESDFLNPQPISSIEEADFFNNDAEVFTGIIGMYDAIQGNNFLGSGFDNQVTSAGIQYEYYLTEMRSDNTLMRDPEGESGEFDSWQIKSTNTIVANYYKSFYEIIFRANKVLAYINNADEENKASYTAEAKFVRAYAYFNLVRLFGDIPLIDSLEDIGTDAEFTRIASDVIYTFIETDLQEAALVLDNSYKSRASNAGAKALLAKVYLTQQKYANAKALCDEIIDSNEFQLEPNYKDIFYNELNNEIIFSVGYVSDNQEESQGFSSEFLGETSTRGTNYLTDNLVGVFNTDLGVDRRLYSFRTEGSTRRQVVKYLPINDNNIGITTSTLDVDLAGNDWIVLRYADVYLMYVEALMEGVAQLNVSNSASPDLSRAKFCFEEIRKRAGVTNYEVEVITKEALLKERRLELAFENQRFFDLLRFGVALETLQEFGLESGNVFTEFDLLLPIPEREITLGNGIMQQNPGY